MMKSFPVKRWALLHFDKEQDRGVKEQTGETAADAITGANFRLNKENLFSCFCADMSGLVLLVIQRFRDQWQQHRRFWL